MEKTEARPKHAKTAVLTEGPVGPILRRMTVPMLYGMVAIMLFNVVDTFWIAKIGALELEAISFTFPVAFIVLSICIGMGIGVSSTVSRAIGAGNHLHARQLATYALFLAFIVVLCITTSIILVMPPLFKNMGASAAHLPIIISFMTTYLGGSCLLAVPIAANGAMRANGDSRTPGVIMLISGAMNALLDPILIFGWGPIPSYGVFGAALATVMAWGISTIAVLYFLWKKEHLLELSKPKLSTILQCWKDVLTVSVPAIATNLLFPLATAAITVFAAQFGAKAVAGFGVGSRLEPLALVVIIALGSILTPFIGQNFSANRPQRVMEALSKSIRFALAWGLSATAILFVFAEPIAKLFSDDPYIIDETITFFRIVPISYCGTSVVMLITSGFNAINRPLLATSLNIMRFFLFYVPFAYLGSLSPLGVKGLFLGGCIGNLAAGATAFIAMKKSALWQHSVN